ncbi:hypothetical protein ABIB49_000468 [Arthrobacter sp. UYCu512]|uniref:hypothetical protein n=1 Tax=Arthrobacter sp. UYCu512 TaxID=3156338 RepID=UPI0033967A90
MTSKELPPLPNGVEYLGDPDGPAEHPLTEDGMDLTVLWAHYRLAGLTVNVGWTIGHVLGSFREPDRLHVGFDAEHYATHVDQNAKTVFESNAFDGITTSFLRAIPMAHARSLMRDRHERLSVASVRNEITPLPARVESDSDYVHVASAYVALGQTSVEPIKRLSEWSGESSETWSARLRRARSKGILEGKGRDARIAPAFVAQSNELWTTMRARKANGVGD